MNMDLIGKRYLSDDARYADLINGIGFGGKQIISAKDLSEYGTETGAWQSAFRKRKTKYRDMVRKVAFGINFAIIGIENQEEPIEAMYHDCFILG